MIDGPDQLVLEPHLPPTPRLETERLVLRGHRMEEFDAFHAMWAAPQTFRFISGKASTPAESQARLLGNLGHWAAFGWGYWAVIEKATGRFAGDVGFGQFRRDITPTLEGMAEMGWVLGPDFHGQGYATEAGRAALAWMDAAMPGVRICAIFHPENTGSIAVGQKLGFAFWQSGQFKGEPTPIYLRGVGAFPELVETTYSVRKRDESTT